MVTAVLSTWPWEFLGSYKYLLFGPLVAKVMFPSVHENYTHNNDKLVALCLHILILSAARGAIYQLWNSFSNMLFLNRNRRLVQDGVDFKQVDSEWHWDNFLILQALVAAALKASCVFSSSSSSSSGSLPVWNLKGLLVALILHVAVSEPLYYWVHRALHQNYLFMNYHSLHHSSKVPQPFTAGHATFLEHLILSVVIGIPVLGTYLLGYGSISMIYGYILTFDFLRCMGHCNVELISHQVFHILPFLKYLVYTPTYHNLHHQRMDTNFCLFMPLYDVLGKTLNPDSWELHKSSTSDTG